MNYDKITIGYTGNEPVRISTQRWTRIGIDVAGTFTNGGFSFLGSNDGNTWTPVPTYNGSVEVTGGEISETGHYTLMVAGFTMIQPSPSGGADFNVTLSCLCVAGGLSGASGSFSSLRLPGMPEGLLFNPGNGQPVVQVPSDSPLKILTSRGKEMPTWESPQEISAFVTGSNLVSNPLPVNSSARFGRITKNTTGGIHTIAPVESSTAGHLVGFASGAGVYVRATSTGIIESSTDLITWTQRASVAALTALRWIQRLNSFVAIGASGTVLTSEDGENWTPRDLGSGATFNAVADNGTNTVFVGSGAASRVTTDFSSYSSGSFVSGAPAQGVVWSGSRWIAAMLYTAGASRTNPEIQYSSNGTSWTAVQLPQDTAHTYVLRSVTLHNSTLIAVGDNGYIATTTNLLGNSGWTLRSSGVSVSLLAVFEANGKLYAVGGNGACIESADNGETWSAPLDTDVNLTLRAGSVDTLTESRVIIVGSSGTMLSGGFPFTSLVYETPTDRANEEGALGSVNNPYPSTPMPIEIVGQLKFNVAALLPSDLPLNFDIVTIADIIFATFATNNPSLTPGPFRCFNAYYDFGDSKWKFGPESVSNYAFLELYDSTTGTLYVKGSTTAGAAGAEITWKDLYSIDKDGGVTFESLKGVGSRAVMVDANGKLSAP